MRSVHPGNVLFGVIHDVFAPRQTVVGRWSHFMGSMQWLSNKGVIFRQEKA